MSTKGLDHIKNLCSAPLDSEGIKMLEKEIIRSVQRRYFEEELISWGKRKYLKSCSIVKLDPFIEDARILRVGGMILRSVLANEIQHPVLLPKSCRITKLIVRWCHEQVAYAGQGMTTNQIMSSDKMVVFGKMYYLEVCQVQAFERKDSATNNDRFAQ